MDTLGCCLLLFVVLLELQGVHPGYFITPLSSGREALNTNMETRFIQADPVWGRTERIAGDSHRSLDGGRPKTSGISRTLGGSSLTSGSKSFLLMNSSVSLPAPAPITSTASTTAGYFVRGRVAMYTPPARFNNDLLPSFANTTATNVTVIRGKTVYLLCHVLNLGTKTVSWVRHHDIHVLTVGRITFTNDDRFEAMNKPGSDVWRLRIKYPQLKDAGKYECQVSIKPPIARVINLNVVEPQAIIPPGPELYVDHGSPLNITCMVPDSPEPPENIFWYHRDKMVSWDGSRRGVSITTEKGPVTTSNLFIPDVTSHDSGVYVCSPQGMKEASVRVRVLNGELPQAMQTGSTCKGCAGSHVLLLLLMAINRLVVL